MAVPTPDPLGQGMFHGFALHWGRVQLRQKTRLHAQEENSICRYLQSKPGIPWWWVHAIFINPFPYIYILYILVWGVTDVRASCMPKIVEHDAVVGIQWMHLDSHWMPMMRRRLEPLAILAQHSAAGPCQARYFADLL